MQRVKWRDVILSDKVVILEQMVRESVKEFGFEVDILMKMRSQVREINWKIILVKKKMSKKIFR